MKQIFASILVMAKAPKVLMGMFSALFITINAAAQAQNVPAPATLTDAEVVAIKNALASNNAAAMSMTPADSSLFVSLIESNNTPIVTRVAQAGSLCGVEVEAGDSVRLYIARTNKGFNLFNDTFYRVPKHVTVKDYSQEAQLDTIASRAWAVEELHEGRPRYREVIAYDRHDGTVGTIPTKGMDMYGSTIIVAGDYNLGGEVTSFGGRIGFAQSWSLNPTGKWSLKVEIDGIYRRTRFSSNAVKAGEPYTCYATELRLMSGLAFGKHNDWRLYAGPMFGEEFYRTDSPTFVMENGSKRTLKSGGNFAYYGGEVRLEWDGYNSPVGAFVEGGYRLHKSVIQNADMETSGVVTFSVGIAVKLAHKTTNNK
jgi:hypothetical protein